MTGLTVWDPDNTPLEGTMLLEASAGTGKTWALERVVARLVGRGESPLDIGEILVVTFTNRAAREMRERIRTILSIRAADTGRGGDERERYRAALSRFDGAPIHTIHGFCQMVLASWPFESSSPFRQELAPAGEEETSEIRSWIAGLDPATPEGVLLKSAWRQADGAEGLVREIRDILLKDNIPPGSTVLPDQEDSRRFAELTAASEDAGGSFNRTAGRLFNPDWSADAVSEIIRDGLGIAKRGPSLDKIRRHMEACRGLRGIEEVTGAMFGDPAGVGIAEHFIQLLDAVLRSSRDGEDETGRLAAAVRSLVNEAGDGIGYHPGAKNPVQNLVPRHLRCSFLDAAKTAVGGRLQDIRDRTGMWSYTDLIRRVADAAADPDSPLLPVLRRRFRAALIDEFQDTDPRQWELFRNIFGAAGDSRPLLLIGDPKQSIYGFRGTGLQAYSSARRTVAEGRRFRLDTNYRSTPALVAAVNRLFEPLFSRSADGAEPVGYEPVKAGRNPPEDASDRCSGPAVTFIRADSRESAADAIVARIRRLIDPSAGARRVPASEIAVLVRGQAEETDIHRRLSDAGVPVVRVRSRTVFRSDPALWLDALLAALERPGDSGSWRSVLLGPFAGFSPGELLLAEESGLFDELVDEAREWRALFDSGRSESAFDDFFRAVVRVGRKVAGLSASGRADRIARPWPVRVIETDDGLRLWQDWRHLCELIQKRQSEGVSDIRGIRSWLIRSADRSDPENSEAAVRLETEEEAVRLMTMHAAKGLEFSMVFLHGGYGGKRSRDLDRDHRFDDSGVLVVDRLCRESTRNRHLAYGWEEDKRLWYVAFTRASCRLWLPVAGEKALTNTESLLLEALVGDCPEEPATGGQLRLPPHLVADTAGAGELRIELSGAIDRLISTEPALFGWETPEPLLPPLRREPIADRPIPAPAPPAGLAARDPMSASYTSLVGAFGRQEIDAGAEIEDRDHDAGGGTGIGVPVSDWEEEEGLPLAPDRGALFGSLVHNLFEICDFGDAAGPDRDVPAADPDTEDRFRGVAARYYPPEWYLPRATALKNLIRSTLRSPIPGLGRLCDIPACDRRAETEFLLAVPRGGTLPVGERLVRTSAGYLRGFIDLLVRRDGRWWVVDWKTNVPGRGGGAGAYDTAGVAELMETHCYHFQYELYLLALCRELCSGRGFPVDWNGEIGGAAYLFVRGTREEDDRGVFTGRPSLERMRELAESLSLGEVIR